MEAVATGYGLIEGPVWDQARGLIYSDVINGGIWALDPDSGNITEIVPKRRGVGGMTPHIENGLVIGGREIIFESFDRSKSAVFFWARTSRMLPSALTTLRRMRKAACGSVLWRFACFQARRCDPVTST